MRESRICRSAAAIDRRIGLGRQADHRRPARRRGLARAWPSPWPGEIRIAAQSAFVSTGYLRVALSGDTALRWLLTRLVGTSGRAN